MGETKPSIKGKFIAVDGVSGVGKTTLIRGLQKNLAASSYKVRAITHTSYGPMQNVADRAGNLDFVRLICHTANLLHRYYVEVCTFLAEGNVVIIENWVAWYKQQIGMLEYYSPQVPKPDLSILLDSCDGSHSAADYRRFYNYHDDDASYIIIPKDHSLPDAMFHKVMGVLEDRFAIPSRSAQERVARGDIELETMIRKMDEDAKGSQEKDDFAGYIQNISVRNWLTELLERRKGQYNV